MAQYGRQSAAQIAAEKERKAREAAEMQINASEPPAVTPVGQRKLLGYKLIRTFSDTSRRPHTIFRKGEVITDGREVARLARIGAELEPVEEAAPDAEGNVPDDEGKGAEG